MYEKLRPTGSQPARLYGLAKIHKPLIPMRPVVSMPGSSYHKIAKKVSKWLSVVEECSINTSTKEIVDSLPNITLPEGHELVSFDVCSLYTNVPVKEAIETCTDLLFSGKYPKPPVSKETFKELLEVCTSDVLILTSDGYYRQTDGLAMGSPPAPLLANGWLNRYEKELKKEAVIYHRYMDDILRDIETDKIDEQLENVNKLKVPNLKFTIEREKNREIPFLDTLIIRKDKQLSSKWYNKPTDTGLVMNYHSLAPTIYKKSVVTGMIHRIFRACSTWKHFHEGLMRAKKILIKNQYPAEFYEPLIKKAIDKLRNPKDKEENVDDKKEEAVEKVKVYLEYRGIVSDNFKMSLNKCKAPVNVVFTLRKVKHVMPSLKAEIEKPYKSGVVYKITCPCCQACYVGQTNRHILQRLKEHQRSSSPVGNHLASCNVDVTIDDVTILVKTSKSEDYLMTLEALWIKEIH